MRALIAPGRPDTAGVQPAGPQPQDSPPLPGTSRPGPHTGDLTRSEGRVPGPDGSSVEGR